jgi:hypothetical protein
MSARTIWTRTGHGVLRALIVWGVIAAMAMHAGCTSAPVAPLSFVAAGVTTDKVLKTLSDRVQTLIGQAAAAGSLLSSKAARDLELLIDASRQELHDELNSNWDTLDGKKIDILRALDDRFKAAEQAMKSLGRMQDQVVLDVEAAIGRLPFTKTVPSVRRVEGATQYFREEGVYRVVIRANFLGTTDAPTRVFLAGKPIESLGIQYVPRPPNDVALVIPANAINGSFDDRYLREIPLKISTEVNNRPWSFQMWRPKTRPAEFDLKLELFPRFPVTYRITEYYETKDVDATKVELKKGPDHVVGGCGDSGCNAYYTFCVDVPAGAQPITAVNHRDTFGGWGGWGGPTVRQNDVCATYWQHSHNQSRSVGFDVHYHPLKANVRTREVDLEELTLNADPQRVASAKAGGLEIGSAVAGLLRCCWAGPSRAVFYEVRGSDEGDHCWDSDRRRCQLRADRVWSR